MSRNSNTQALPPQILTLNQAMGSNFDCPAAHMFLRPQFWVECVSSGDATGVWQICGATSPTAVPVKIVEGSITAGEPSTTGFTVREWTAPYMIVRWVRSSGDGLATITVSGGSL